LPERLIATAGVPSGRVGEVGLLDPETPTPYCSLMSDASAWLHPWLRLQLADSRYEVGRADVATVTTELRNALNLREVLRRAPW